MKFIADLHIHSHFSRATSQSLNPENLVLWARKKGITVIGTGDFTHPGWLSELREKLIEAENGLYRLRSQWEKRIKREIPNTCLGETRFLLSGEISCIYKRDGKTRKLHHLILMPDMDAVFRLNEKLGRIGNLSSDGRPILGLDSRDLLEIVLEVSDKAFFIPAHIWTPWFSLFGSKSGFDSIEDCFGDLSSHIHALETGLSSDPPMNRLYSGLDGYLLVSNSDAHSPSKLGREANLFDTELDYDLMVQAMINGEGFQGTVEFFPEEGKYHLDGHRKCQVRLHPKETLAYEAQCPHCGKPLTIGVLHRVLELSDRDTPGLSKAYSSLIPLSEILSEILDCGPSTKRVSEIYEHLLSSLGPEIHILLHLPLKEIESAGGMLLSEAIGRMRQGKVIKEEGYDGEYGIIRLFREMEKEALSGQMALFGFSRKEKDKREREGSITSFKKVSEKRIGDDVQPIAPPLSNPILGPLNPQQREAVLHQGSHLLIIAGPGTGKTMTLTHRIVYTILSGETALDQILALTFTRKAAMEMGRRVTRWLGDENPEDHQKIVHRVRVSTFHGFCLQILKDDGEKIGLPNPFTVCSEMDAQALAQQVMHEAGKKKRLAAHFMKNLPRLKRLSLTGEEKDRASNDLLPFFRSYQKRLRDLDMLDLDDLEVETLRLFQEHPEIGRKVGSTFSRIYVDEYQDTNPVQVAILKRLIDGGDGRICAIGDPDQAIYGFRGADVRNFPSFNRDFPEAREIILYRNYRSTQIILAGASALMKKKEPLEGGMGKGDFIRVAACRTHAEEAEMIIEQIEKLMGATTTFSLDSGRVSSHEEGMDLGFDDIAVLFRLNAQGDALEEAFSRSGIPYARSGEKPLINRYPVNLLWRFFQASLFPENPYYLNAYMALLDEKRREKKDIFRRIDRKGPPMELIEMGITLHDLDRIEGDGLDTLNRLKELGRDFDGDLASFLDFLSLERGIDHGALRGDRVALMSLHASKGLEWPVVFLTGCEEGILPCSLFGDRDEEEEKRLFYVGMTRAGRKLILSSAHHRIINRRKLHARPSPFLDLLPPELCAPLERSKGDLRGKRHKQLNLF
ncbi:MAG: UvrD-helicase domain-containing protein [Pseudomonadota bacterium]